MTFVLLHMLSMGFGGMQGSADGRPLDQLLNPAKIGKRG